MALRLEVFDTGPAAPTDTVVTDVGALEEARLASYEQGYTAGWDDAVAAQSGDQTRLRADLARNLQGLAFTYHEARAHLLKSVEPLFETLVARILPDLARASLGGQVVALLRAQAEAASDVPVELVINPAARAAVEAALDGLPAPPVALVEEDTLGDGQAWLRLGPRELRIDLDRAVADIAAAVRAFFDLSQEDQSHGR
jgi:flagellar assembly protein FliH